MTLYLLEPEVAGELGDNTVFENFDSVRLNGDRPKVTHLHYTFTGWLGDELLECTPCFIVTEGLAKAIKESKLNGYTFKDVEISVEDEFVELYPNTKLPVFKRLLPQGSVEVDGDNFKAWTGHDFCISQKSYLVVTEKALDTLKSHKIDNCDITELSETY